MTGTNSQEIAADVERQRDELARTVEALQAKLDVKSRAKHRAELIRDRWTTEAGRPRPELLMAGAAAVVLVVGIALWRRNR